MKDSLDKIFVYFYQTFLYLQIICYNFEKQKGKLLIVLHVLRIE